MQCHVGLYFSSKCFLIAAAMSFSTVWSSMAWQPTVSLSGNTQSWWQMSEQETRETRTSVAECIASLWRSSRMSTHLTTTRFSSIVLNVCSVSCYMQGSPKCAPLILAKEGSLPSSPISSSWSTHRFPVRTDNYVRRYKWSYTRH